MNEMNLEEAKQRILTAAKKHGYSPKKLEELSEVLYPEPDTTRPSTRRNNGSKQNGAASTARP